MYIWKVKVRRFQEDPVIMNIMKASNGIFRL